MIVGKQLKAYSAGNNANIVAVHSRPTRAGHNERRTMYSSKFFRWTMVAKECSNSAHCERFVHSNIT